MERDMRMGSTMVGPHRDELSFEVGGSDAKDFASEGQQRSVTLALRLAQAAWFQERSGVRPVLLADDVLGELDSARRESFWAALDPESQVIATGTGLPDEALGSWEGIQGCRGCVHPRTLIHGGSRLNFHAWEWFIAVIGALLVGIAKTGITGLSLLFVALFASVMPARRSTGLVLPLLIVGDIFAFTTYRRHTQWRHVWRLLPWAAAGVVIGALIMGRMDERMTRLTMGVIVLGLAALHLVRRMRPALAEQEHPVWFAPLLGILAGFTTIVSNAAGPLMVIYLLAMRLPKMEYMGTGAAFFLMLNLFKLPFMLSLGLISRESLMLNLVLAPAVIAGTVLGRWLLGRINQRHFDSIAIALTIVAGFRMLF